jgi:phage tail tape-measure protein
MEKQQPSRPVKTKQTFKPAPNEVSEDELATPTNLEPEVTVNRYARKVKVGSVKTIGRSPNYVESIGLGNLRVITSSGVLPEAQ